MCESDMYRLVPASESVISDYTVLYNTVDSLDNPDHIGLTDDYFRSSFSSPNVSLERDTVLVRNSDGTLIASGIIFPQTSSTSRVSVQVHPEYRRKGIGSLVLRRLIEIGITSGSSSLVCRFPSFRPYVVPFARRHGFNYEYSWNKMRIEHKTPVPTPSLPWGLTVRGLNIKKELTVWAHLQNTIFKDHPNYRLVDVETLRSKTKHSRFDRNLLILCIIDNKPVGYAIGYSIKSETGEKTLKIDAIGVLPEHRRKRYGQALIYELLNRAYIKGHTSSELVVLSTNRPAIRLYEKCGFGERYKYLWYKQAI